MKTSALITIYFPDETVFDNVRRVASQVDSVFLCDNSPSENKELFANIDNVVYFWFGKNLGLSKAFNSILKQSDLFSDDDFIIFFDQDATISEKHIESLRSEYINLAKLGYDVGCLNAVYFDPRTNSLEIPKRKKYLTSNTFCVKQTMTDSMLCKYSDLKNVGFWNEDIFLDYADWELCWRFVKMKKLCCMTTIISFNHVGGKGIKKIGFFKGTISVPFRQYYQTRDALYVLRYDYVSLYMRIKFINSLTVKNFFRILFLNSRKQRIHFIKKGFVDFLKNVHGELA